MSLNIYTIIVTYNATKWIDKCFGSLRQSTIPLHTVIIDNKSSDNSVDIIKENYPEVIVIESESNLGFGKGNNKGIEYALSQGADYVFLLNQDAWIYPDTIEKLLKVTNQGIICPIQLDGTGKKLGRGFSNYISALNKSSALDEFFMEREADCYSIPFVNAAAWLIPVETIKIIGGFDPLFFHYGEDYNYGQRIKFHGLSFSIVPHAFICHDAKSDGPSDFFLKYETRHDFLLLYANINKNIFIYQFFACHYNFIKRFIRNLFSMNFKAIRDMLFDSYFIIRNMNKILISKQVNRKKGMAWLNHNNSNNVD